MIPLNLPAPEEQQHIEACFAAVDTELAGLSDLDVTLTSQKRGLMQQLLTGKKRVHVGIEEDLDDQR